MDQKPSVYCLWEVCFSTQQFGSNCCSKPAQQCKFKIQIVSPPEICVWIEMVCIQTSKFLVFSRFSCFGWKRWHFLKFSQNREVSTNLQGTVEVNQIEPKSENQFPNKDITKIVQKSDQILNKMSSKVIILIRTQHFFIFRKNTRKSSCSRDTALKKIL